MSKMNRCSSSGCTNANAGTMKQDAIILIKENFRIVKPRKNQAIISNDELSQVKYKQKILEYNQLIQKISNTHVKALTYINSDVAGIRGVLKAGRVGLNDLLSLSKHKIIVICKNHFLVQNMLVFTDLKFLDFNESSYHAFKEICKHWQQLSVYPMIKAGDLKPLFRMPLKVIKNMLNNSVDKYIFFDKENKFSNCSAEEKILLSSLEYQPLMSLYVHFEKFKLMLKKSEMDLASFLRMDSELVKVACAEMTTLYKIFQVDNSSFADLFQYTPKSAIKMMNSSMFKIIKNINYAMAGDELESINLLFQDESIVLFAKNQNNRKKLALAIEELSLKEIKDFISILGEFNFLEKIGLMEVLQSSKINAVSVFRYSKSKMFNLVSMADEIGSLLESISWEEFDKILPEHKNENILQLFYDYFENKKFICMSIINNQYLGGVCKVDNNSFDKRDNYITSSEEDDDSSEGYDDSDTVTDEDSSFGSFHNMDEDSSFNNMDDDTYPDGFILYDEMSEDKNSNHLRQSAGDFENSEDRIVISKEEILLGTVNLLGNYIERPGCNVVEGNAVDNNESDKYVAPDLAEDITVCISVIGEF